MTWATLKDHCKTAGRVVRADVSATDAGVSRGWGVVIFETPEDARAAIAVLDGSPLFDRRIHMRLDREQHCRVFCSNLLYRTTWFDLKNMFRAGGLAPVHAEIAMDNAGRSR